MDIIAAAATAVSLVLIFTYLPKLPERVPTHFSFSGKPDDWGPKTMLWIFPALSVLTYVALSIIARFPRIFNYPVPVTPENAERLYRIGRETMAWLKADCCVIAAGTEWLVIRAILTGSLHLGAWVAPGVIALIAVTLGAQIVRMYRAR